MSVYAFMVATMLFTSFALIATSVVMCIKNVRGSSLDPWEKPWCWFLISGIMLFTCTSSLVTAVEILKVFNLGVSETRDTQNKVLEPMPAER